MTWYCCISLTYHLARPLEAFNLTLFSSYNSVGMLLNCHPSIYSDVREYSTPSCFISTVSTILAQLCSISINPKRSSVDRFLVTLNMILTYPPVCEKEASSKRSIVYVNQSPRTGVTVNEALSVCPSTVTTISNGVFLVVFSTPLSSNSIIESQSIFNERAITLKSFLVLIL